MWLLKESFIVIWSVKIKLLLLKTLFKFLRELLLFLGNLHYVIWSFIIHHNWCQINKSFFNLFNNCSAFFVKLFTIKILILHHLIVLHLVVHTSSSLLIVILQVLFIILKLLLIICLTHTRVCLGLDLLLLPLWLITLLPIIISSLLPLQIFSLLDQIIKFHNFFLGIHVSSFLSKIGEDQFVLGNLIITQERIEELT